MTPEIQEENQGVNYFVYCDVCKVIRSNLTLAQANLLAHQHNLQNFDHYAEVIVEHD